MSRSTAGKSQFLLPGLSVADTVTPSGTDFEGMSDDMEIVDEKEQDSHREQHDEDPTMDRYIAKTNPFHHVTDQELSDLLEYLPTSYKQETKERLIITAILKKYGYRQVWQRWLSNSGSESEWRSADWTHDDLNYLVEKANRSSKKYRDDKTMVIPKFEKIYFPIPSLSDENKARITQRVDVEYLSTDLFDTGKRVACIQSCTGTGKTYNTIKYAREQQMLVLSVCHLITQVQEHDKVFRDKENGLPTETIKYDDTEALRRFQPGVHNYITTLDSLPKIKKLLGDHLGKYILYLDEIHSIIGYLLTSSTLSGSRKDVISALAWLMNGAGKVIMTDNIILDRDVAFIDSILCRNVKGLELDFIVNSHQKYTGIKVSHTHDPEAVLTAMRSDLVKDMGFTCPCNTKNRAEEIDM